MVKQKGMFPIKKAGRERQATSDNIPISPNIVASKKSWDETIQIKCDPKILNAVHILYSKSQTV